ncbi:hypothetical protein ACFRAO_32390 [Streptomyces sp. NPDC056656]
MSEEINITELPSSELLLVEESATAPLAQITQEVLQSVSYRTRNA